MNDQASTEIPVADFAPQTERMRAEVLAGLRRTPKYIPSKYLYDQAGSQLFDRICEQPEYYLTRTEMKILREQGPGIAETVGPGVCVIEPGSGNAIKARLLLEQLDRPAMYVPVEISREHMQQAAEELALTFPEIRVYPVCADFTSHFHLPEEVAGCHRRLVFFPGSTIGNFLPGQAIELLRTLRELAGPQGAVLIGVDTKKDPSILVPAYDDAAGVSAGFALNVLDRLNDELDADFDRSGFGYGAAYNERHGRIEMFLLSRCDQSVRIGSANVSFAAGERIRTEYSHKFSPEDFAALSRQAGLNVEAVWMDPKRLFSVQYLTPART